MLVSSQLHFLSSDKKPITFFSAYREHNDLTLVGVDFKKDSQISDPQLKPGERILAQDLQVRVSLVGSSSSSALTMPAHTTCLSRADIWRKCVRASSEK
jgi:hypothetical protein